MTKRPSWIAYFQEIAKAVSLRGDCTRSQVGAVLWDLRTKQVISTGYNGVAPGARGCIEGACPRGQLSYEEHPERGSYSNCIAIHAEDNAIRWVRTRSELKGKNLAISITREPCVDCLVMLDQYGIFNVFWPGGQWIS